MYKLIKSPVTGELNGVELQVESVLLSIPFDPANTDYQEYLKWVAEGNLPIPAESTEGSANPEPLPADEPS